ncbi:hypothetical protein ACH4E8_34805 [Streptomyces sp. NPDC017979]|uniref:hypothetical protein n=1 Tax=unclassified Streptomyces TaxID=2593676 RepID=UPI0037BD9336
MAERLRTWVDGREVDVPSTIPAIRDALPAELRAEFDLAVNTAGVHEIHAVVRHWMFEAVPDPQADAIEGRLTREEAERRGAA